VDAVLRYIDFTSTFKCMGRDRSSRSAPTVKVFP
jgi:hypothetical protein